MPEKKYLIQLRFYVPFMQAQVDSIEEAEELREEQKRIVFNPEFQGACDVGISELKRNPAYKKE